MPESLCCAVNALASRSSEGRTENQYTAARLLSPTMSTEVRKAAHRMWQQGRMEAAASTW
jgi:hypothetical protein